jgi:uncharacterized protein YjbI with pentapeptide repeats
MADEELLKILQQGVAAWNTWRKANPDELIDFTGTDLSGADLSWVNLSGSDLTEANLTKADLSWADLNGANLTRANLREAALTATFIKANLSKAFLGGADLTGANLEEADLFRANFTKAYLNSANLSRAKMGEANLFGADLPNADLSNAHLVEVDLREANLLRANLAGSDLSNSDLRMAHLVETNLEGSILTGCNIYGISAWGLKLSDAKQNDLIITPSGEPTITVDNLEVAQFLYILLQNEKIRDVIDTVAKKVVLILGRFTEDRKPVLTAIKDKLRDLGYLPVLFDFDPPTERNTFETVTLLARLSRFIISDITEPRSVPQELSDIVRFLPSVPVMPIIQEGHEPWRMYDSIQCYPWVLGLQYYSDVDSLLNSFEENIIDPAISKANELRAGH